LGLVYGTYCWDIQYPMRFAVVPKYERGRLLSDNEIEAKAALVGELSTYECPREPGGAMRHMASVHTPVGQVVRPIIEPRITTIGHSGFLLRGLEEYRTERGWVYVLQEWLVTDVRDAQKGQPIA
jgi:hypothetical protein